MNNLHIVCEKNNDKMSAPKFERPIVQEDAAIQPYRTELDDQLLVHPHTGQLFMNTPGMELTFPLLAVRHGQTDGNIQRMFQGQIDIPASALNETGKAQVKQTAIQLYTDLAAMFQGHLADFARAGRVIVLKSPMSRTQATAAAFLEYFEQQTGLALPSTIEKDLIEMGFGVLEGWRHDDVKDHQLKQLVFRYKQYQDATVDWNGTGESFVDVVKRAKKLLERLNAQYQHNNKVLVIAFSHGALITALRTVVGDTTLLEENGMIAFRSNCLRNAEAHWLGQSLRLAEGVARSFPYTPVPGI